MNLIRIQNYFIIACEGAVREREYFEHLGEYSSHIRIKVLKNTDNNSAPKWLLDSAVRHVEQTGMVDDDQLWFVLDTDRWPQDQLRSIHHECESKSNWFIALSNPCFEVWLYMHVSDIQKSTSQHCQQFKKELSDKIDGGYNKTKFVPLIRTAMERSSRLDPNPKHFLPDPKRTKLHLLAREMLTFIGKASGI